MRGQSVLVHGAAGVVGSMASQLAREAGAYVIGTGRAGARQTALDFGAQEFVDLDNDALEDVGKVDLVFRCPRRRHREAVCGRDSRRRNAGDHHRPHRGAARRRPDHRFRRRSRARAQLSELVQRVRNGRLKTNIGNVAALDDAVAAFNRTERIKGKTIIRVRP